MSIPLQSERCPLIFKFFRIFKYNKKKIEILTKIHTKNTILAVENREPYYFIIICKCKEGSLRLFSYHMLASTLTMDEQSIYYKARFAVCKAPNCSHSA